MIVLVDYGMGNLGSVAKALAFLGQTVTVSQDPEVAVRADRLILPGVGAMQYAVSRLQDKGLDGAIRQYLQKGRPFLGICLGMQLMFDRSEEGDARGLGILPGCVRRFPARPGLKVPHMGWNRLVESRLQLLPDQESFYFVHSYYVQPDQPEMTAASCSHGIVFAAAVQVGPILLTQFHPEKSGDAGLRLLTRWLDE
jgi:glutamine amidotransferase